MSEGDEGRRGYVFRGREDCVNVVVVARDLVLGSWCGFEA